MQPEYEHDAAPGVTRGHPICLAESYLSDGFAQSPKTPPDLSIDSLVKLLLFGDYVKAKKGVDVVGVELEKYPYPRKTPRPVSSSQKDIVRIQ